MSDYQQRRAGIRPAAPGALTLAVGERVRIVNAPASYGYNGRAGVVLSIDGSQISVQMDDHPDDQRCSTFYTEELEREAGA